jgi:hypothetical protein
MVPSPVMSPRGSEWAASAALGLCRGIWRVLETIGERRAQRELRQLAARWEPFKPELSRQLRAACRGDRADA